LDENFGFLDSVMPEDQRFEKMKTIAERNISDFMRFRSGLKTKCYLNRAIIGKIELHGD